MTATTEGIREIRRRETLAQLLDAAWALAREHGVGALSLHDLARAVGMRQPSLYTYFDSKHGLYDLMFRDANTNLLARARAIQPSGDPVADLHAFPRVLVEFARENAPRYELVFHRPIPGFVPSAEAYEPAREFLALFVRHLAAVGVTEPGDVDLFVAGIAGLVDAQVANDPTGDRWTRHLDRVLDIYLAALAPVPAANAPTSTEGTRRRRRPTKGRP